MDQMAPSADQATSGDNWLHSRNTSNLKNVLNDTQTLACLPAASRYPDDKKMPAVASRKSVAQIAGSVHADGIHRRGKGLPPSTTTARVANVLLLYPEARYQNIANWLRLPEEKVRNAVRSITKQGGPEVVLSKAKRSVEQPSFGWFLKRTDRLLYGRLPGKKILSKYYGLVARLACLCGVKITARRVAEWWGTQRTFIERSQSVGRASKGDSKLFLSAAVDSLLGDNSIGPEFTRIIQRYWNSVNKYNPHNSVIIQIYIDVATSVGLKIPLERLESLLDSVVNLPRSQKPRSGPAISRYLKSGLLNLSFLFPFGRDEKDRPLDHKW